MLRVRASALNHLDLNLRDGRSYRGTLPRILGCDVAGEVVAASPEINTNIKVGDRVLLDNRMKCTVCENCRLGLDQYCTSQQRIGVDLDGGHAEYLTAPARNAYRIPDSMGFTEAAALPIAGHTAWHCLVTQAQIRPWDDVLVQAAGSGVGSMGIQIAKMMGARVITTAGSDWKLEKAKELGADEVINYRETPDFSERIREFTDGRGVDLVFDCVGADVWEQSLLALKPGGAAGYNGSHLGLPDQHGPFHIAGPSLAPDGKRRPQPTHLRRHDEDGAPRGAARHRGAGISPGGGIPGAPHYGGP